MSRFAAKHTTELDQSLKDDSYQHGFAFPTDKYTHILKPGLRKGVVEEISAIKNEPEWMLKLRLIALEQFLAKPTPIWGGDLLSIDYDKIHYYLRPTDTATKTWAEVPLEIRTTFDRLGIPEAERDYLAGVKMQYDCLTADTAVFTENGAKKIIDIQAGERVYSLNEITNLLELQRVKGLEDKGTRKVFKVVIQGGREIKVTANHPFWHLAHKKLPGKTRGKYHKEWKYLSELQVGDLVALTTKFPEYGTPYRLPKIEKTITKVKSRNQFGEHDLDISNWYAKLSFPKLSDEDLLWLLGFYIGDGFFASKNARGQRKGVDLAVPDFEPQLGQEIARIVKKLFGYDLLVRQKYKVSINSILFVKFFEELGFSGNAYTKRVPQWVFALPQSQRLAFIGGYFDADGTIRKTNCKNLVFTSVSKELLGDIQMLALSCGLNVSHIWGFNSSLEYKGEAKVYAAMRMNISGDVERVGSRMVRKRELFTKLKFSHTYSMAKGTDFRKHVSDNIGFARILSIEEAGEEPVYDIEVDGFHNFVANGLIVHNSEVVYGSLKNVWAKDGVIFLSMDEGLAQYPELVKEYFGKLIPSGDNKFSALNTSVWSGGSFVYIPKNVQVKMPLQTYFRINAPNAGQFERTLIIVDERASVHYVEGCFVAGTKVSTEAGLVRIEDIKKEDKVLTHKGRYQQVYHTQVRPYTGELHTVELAGNPIEKIQATSEHPFLIVKRQRKNERNSVWSPEWVPIKEVKAEDYLCVPITNSNKESELLVQHQDKDYSYVSITSISSQKVKNIPVYNFSVKDDESYVAGGVSVHNCTAPSFSSSSLHSAVVEIYVKKGARCQYTTVQNWYKNIYNLVTKRARVEEEGEMVWTDFNMGCLTADTRVFVEGKGAISISEVRAEDQISSVDLNILKPIKSRVIKAQQTGIKKVYKLKTENGRIIRATDNHPFLHLSQSSLMGGFSKLTWKQLKEIKVGDKIAMVQGLPEEGKPKAIDFSFAPKRKSNQTLKSPQIPKFTTEDLMWLLGLYIGDGYCERGKDGRGTRVYFAVPPADRARKKLEEMIPKVFGLIPRPKGIFLTVASVMLAEFIFFMGLAGNAHQKRIPAWVFDLPRRQKLAFIHGYLDSDGSLVHQKEKEGVLYGQIVFASANKPLLEDLKLLMISSGLNPLNIATYRKFRTLYKGQWKYYTCHFLNLNIRDNLTKILDKEDEESEIEFTRVWEVTQDGEEAVYDLEIEGVANFIANGLVVHNSKLTMKYPGFILAGKGAKGETLSMALAGAGQHQDTGSKAIHLAPHTSSTIISKSISKNGGRTSYRGLVNVGPNAHDSKNTVICDALLLDPESRSDTYPVDRIYNSQVQIQHEATVSRIGDEQLFYLMSRGLTEETARKMIVNGFIDEIVKKLPLEYAVEMNRLIDHEMEGSIG